MAADLIPAIAQINWFEVVGTVAKYVAIVLFMAACIAAAWFATYIGKFKIKALEFPLYASGDSGQYSIGRGKNQRFRWKDKTKTSWVPLLPFGNKIEVEPFSQKYVYDGNRVFCFKYGEKYVPGVINVKKDSEGNIKGDLDIVPHFMRKWQSIMHKQYAQELQKQGFWEENKYFIMGVITVAICCATALATIYISYNMVGASRADMQALTNVIRGLGNIPGR